MAKAAFRILFGDIGVEPNLVLLGSPLEFSKRKVKEMKNKFDDCIVVGNPPYQGSRSPAGGPAKAIYHKFVQFAKELNPSKIIMITPSRWFSGGMGLSSFRQEMLNDRRIKKIVDYPSALECFPGVSIKGGVSYFLWDKDKGYDDNCEITTVINGTIDGPHKRPLNQYDILVRLNGTILVLEKMEAKKGLKTTMESQVKAGCPFGLKTDFKNYKKDPFDSCIKVYGNRWRGYITVDQVVKNHKWIDKYKVLIPEASDGSGSFPIQVLGKPIIAQPGEVCTATYLVCGVYDTIAQAENFARYLKTKFVRFLVSPLKSTQHTNKNNFIFVPILDMNTTWTDEMLYKSYGLDDSEIAFIEKMIKEMK